jgi:hypothetical protein
MEADEASAGLAHDASHSLLLAADDEDDGASNFDFLKGVWGIRRES